MAHSSSKLFPTVSPAKLPVSMITGFLGSGKTTLLNRLLLQKQMANTAVIINEFGEVSLDGALIGSQSGEVITLANGCMCCFVGDDFESAMSNLYRGDAEAGAIKRILIETSGLADPAPIIGSLLNSPMMANYCALDSVITTVDAAYILTQIEEHPEAASQIAFADRLVITKSDLASPEQLTSVKSAIRNRNQHGKVIVAAKGEVPVNELFGVQSKDGKANAAHIEDVIRTISTHDHDCDQDDAHRHTPSVKAFAILESGAIEWSHFNAWFRKLRIAHGDDLLRMKGILDVRGEQKPVVVHGVRHILHPPSALESWRGIERASRLVFIVRGTALEKLITESFAQDVAAIGARAM